jgi:hypothetical protein
MGNVDEQNQINHMIYPHLYYGNYTLFPLLLQVTSNQR